MLVCISIECGTTKTKVIKRKKKGLEISKAIKELMKQRASRLKCGKGEGSSRDVNLVFQSDWLRKWRDLFEPITQPSNLSKPNCSRATPISGFVYRCSKT